MRAVTLKRAFTLTLALLLTLLLAQALAGCGSVQTPPLPVAETPEPTEEPAPPEPPELHLGSLTVSPDAESLALEGSGATIDELIGASEALGAVKKISLGLTEASGEELRSLTAAFPQAEIDWSTDVLGTETDCRTESLDLSAASDDDVDALVSALERLPELKTIALAPEGGLTALSFESLSALAAAAPEAELECRFELFGQTADWTTEKLKYYKTAVGNEGIDRFREALPYLRALTLLRFESCGIDDYDKIDALRSDFPEKNVVWSIPIAGYNYMTDTTLINDGDTYFLSDNNSDLLRYMHDVLYLDVGHNKHLTNIDFARSFPKLQVVILTLTDIRDISPLEDCADLEFLECHGTPIDDIGALAGKEKLEYLNIGNMPNLRDLTPLFGLKQLKVVRICGTTRSHISQEDIDALKEELPDTFVSDYGGDPNSSGGWRFKIGGGGITERYALLRKQMLYDLNWQQRLSNSPSREEN